MAHAPRAIDQQLRYYVLDHLLDVIESARVFEDPFPHFQVREFFPRDLYTHLLHSLPPLSAYEPFDQEKRSTTSGESHCHRYRMKDAWLDKLPGEASGFWRTLRSVLADIELKQTVFEKLQQGLASRYGCAAEEAAELPGFALSELFRETSAYPIRPQRDPRRNVVSMQISLVPDGSQEHFGTELYRRRLSLGTLFRQPRGFEVVKKLPLLPNSAFAFVVFNRMRLKSWHGRSRIAGPSGVRDMLLNTWYAKAKYANQEVLEEDSFAITKPRAA